MQTDSIRIRPPGSVPPPGPGHEVEMPPEHIAIGCRCGECLIAPVLEDESIWVYVCYRCDTIWKIQVLKHIPRRFKELAN